MTRICVRCRETVDDELSCPYCGWGTTELCDLVDNAYDDAREAA